jgi:hypothetical protein
MTKAGNRHGRWRTTEWAWSGVRDQPERTLSGWFRKRCGGGGKCLRRMGMVAVARQWLMARGRFLETGVFPEGAVRKEAEVGLRCCVRLRSGCWWRRPVGLPGS